MSEETNVANDPTLLPSGQPRIPMSLPQQKFAAPNIPGYFTFWFLDKPGRIHQAMQAGFEFVSEDEFAGGVVSNTGVADNVVKSGNEDLGTRVSRYGGVGEGGHPQMHYLMKQKLEWHEQDDQVHKDRSKLLENTLRRKKVLTADGETEVDKASRYVKTSEFVTPSQPKRRV